MGDEAAMHLSQPCLMKADDAFVHRKSAEAAVPCHAQNTRSEAINHTQENCQVLRGGVCAALTKRPGLLGKL